MLCIVFGVMRWFHFQNYILPSIMMFHTGEIFSELDIATYYCVLREGRAATTRTIIMGGVAKACSCSSLSCL